MGDPFCQIPAVHNKSKLSTWYYSFLTLQYPYVNSKLLVFSDSVRTGKLMWKILLRRKLSTLCWLNNSFCVLPFWIWTSFNAHSSYTRFKMMKCTIPDVQPTLYEMVWITSIHCDLTYRNWCAPLSGEFHNREFLQLWIFIRYRQS